MNKILISIFMCITLVLGLNGLRGNVWQAPETELAVIGLYTNDLPDQETPATGDKLTNTDDCCVLDAFNFYTCDFLCSVFPSLRGGGFSKNVRYASTIQMLSAKNMPLVEKSSKNLYFQYCFVKSSYRYFIYTLERLLI